MSEIAQRPSQLNLEKLAHKLHADPCLFGPKNRNHWNTEMGNGKIEKNIDLALSIIFKSIVCMHKRAVQRDLAPSAFALMKESLKCLPVPWLSVARLPDSTSASTAPTSEAFKLTLRMRWLGNLTENPSCNGLNKVPYKVRYD